MLVKKAEKTSETLGNWLVYDFVNQIFKQQRPEKYVYVDGMKLMACLALMAQYRVKIYFPIFTSWI